MLSNFDTRIKKKNMGTIKVNGRCFNADFCVKYTESQLREIYKHESVETLDLLVEAIKELKDGNGSNPEGKRVSGRKSKG